MSYRPLIVRTRWRKRCFRMAGHIIVPTPNVDLFEHVSISISASFVFHITLVDYDQRQDSIGLVGSAKLCDQQTEGSCSCTEWQT